MVAGHRSYGRCFTAEKEKNVTGKEKVWFTKLFGNSIWEDKDLKWRIEPLSRFSKAVFYSFIF